MIRVIFLLVAIISADVTTTWDNENVRFSHASNILVKEITDFSDSLDKQRQFEISIPNETSKIYLTIGTGRTVHEASLTVSSLNNWWVADSFKRSAPGDGSAPRLQIWNYQDSLFYLYDFTKSDTSNYVRFAYADMTWDLLDRFTYGESDNQFFYSFYFIIPINAETSSRLGSLIDVMRGTDFINRNRGGSKNGANSILPAARPLGKKGFDIKREGAFNLLGRRLPLEPHWILFRH